MRVDCRPDPVLAPRYSAAISTLAPPAQTFARGRDFAASLGLTLLQRSTGGKQKLGGTSKRGRPHNTPPIDHRGQRCSALGCANLQGHGWRACLNASRVCLPRWPPTRWHLSSLGLAG
jgi:hypothetical protein